LTSTWGKKHLQTPAALPASSSSPAASHPYPLTDAPGKTAPKDLSWKSATPVPSQTPKVPLSSAEDLANELFHSSLDDNDNTSSPADAPSTSTAPPPPSSSANILLPPPVHEENQHDSDEDSSPEAGEWITPTNISTHKARDLGLSLPDDDEAGGGSKKKKKSKSKPRAIMKSACMTSDFAVQNVLLQMGLNLVGGEGRRIRSVRSWVLRCHACFRYVPPSHSAQACSPLFG
jgi:RNA-binding protein NOB1